MKKISFIAFALCTGTILFAQNQPKLRTEMEVATRFGIKGGVNLANLSDEGYPASSNFNSNNKTGYNAGLLVNVPLTEEIKFQPEVTYSLQGAKSSYTTAIPTGSVTTQYKTNLGYINVPLMFQLQTTKGFFVELGPQFSYLISAKNKDNNSGADAVDIKDQLNKFDVAASGGIGYFSRIGLGIDARYNYGFKNILDEENSNYISGTKLKNRVYQVGLFYQFGANK